MKKKYSLLKILQNISTSLIFIVTAIFICTMTELINLTPAIIYILGIIVILCFGCIFTLPWINFVEEKKFKTLSIIFISSIIVCALLWIISFIAIVNSSTNNTDIQKPFDTLIRISLFLSIQLVVASNISSIILKYKKSMLTLQIITYISYAFLDIYFSIITITFSSKIFNFDKVVDVLFSQIMLTLLVIALAFVFISNIIIKRIDKKRINNMLNSENTIQQNTESQKTEFEYINEKLIFLKDLFDKNLITQEEYDNKKAELLNRL